MLRTNHRVMGAGNTFTGRAMAGRTSRNPRLPISVQVDLAAKFDQRFVSHPGFQHLDSVKSRYVRNILIAEIHDERHHFRHITKAIPDHAGLTARIVFMLASQLGPCRNCTITIRPVAGGTGSRFLLTSHRVTKTNCEGERRGQSKQHHHHSSHLFGYSIQNVFHNLILSLFVVARSSPMTAIAHLLARAEYTTSVHELSQLPPDAGIEVAIAGRSNAGKSSLINRICRQNNLAKTSRTPGRTRQLVFFRLDPLRHLVDLPGYGYARVSGSLKKHWQGLIQTYLDRRQALRAIVVVMDIRHPLKDTDVELIQWAGSRGIPLHLVLTKADKLGHGKQKEAVMKVRQRVNPSVGVQAFSSQSGLGLEALQDVMSHWLEPDRVLLPAAGDSQTDLP